MKKKIYISLPISADEQSAREKADNIKQALSRQGWEVVNPFDIYCGKKPTYEDYICYDLRAMLDCDAIYFCKGWEGSCGCRIEFDVAVTYMTFGKKDFKIMYEQGTPEDTIIVTKQKSEWERIAEASDIVREATKELFESEKRSH